MSKLAVNNPNIVIIASSKDRWARETASELRARRNHKLAIVRRLRRERIRLEELACSSTWAEDCLFRSADYAPDFKCNCRLCREKFRSRRYPRGVRESDYSLDCQVECDEDPELAEDLARLRNERLRVGSVFIGNSRRTPDVSTPTRNHGKK